MAWTERSWVHVGFMGLLVWMGVSVVLFFQYFYSIFFVEKLQPTVLPFLYFPLPNLNRLLLWGICAFLVGALIGLIIEMIRLRKYQK